MTPAIDRIYQKDVLTILDGDRSVSDEYGNDVSMTYLSGPDIFALFGVMNLETSLEPGVSRWMVMEDFIKASIEANCLNESLTYLFKKIDPSKVKFRLSTPRETVEYIVETILKELNLILFRSNISIKSEYDRIVVIIGDSPILDSKSIEQIVDLEYIRKLKERCENDLLSKNYEGVITKSRTMLEEVFIYVIGEGYDKKEYGGNIGKLFEKVREICNLSKEHVPLPIKNIVSCLNSIVDNVAQIRNNYSESHGVGHMRIQLSNAETMLVINSSITLAEYILSVHSSASSLGDRTFDDRT